MALHEQSVGASDEWYTPPHVFDAMGVWFDMDVASPGFSVVPWVPAPRHLTAVYDGLAVSWNGFVWMNPPFGARNGLAPWLKRFFTHGDGVALVPDRTSAPWWQDYAPKADALLFVRKKLRFLRPDGSEGASPAQGTTLMAAGPRGIKALEEGLGPFGEAAKFISAEIEDSRFVAHVPAGSFANAFRKFANRMRAADFRRAAQLLTPQSDGGEG
jgi:hypothetical protein